MKIARLNCLNKWNFFIYYWIKSTLKTGVLNFCKLKIKINNGLFIENFNFYIFNKK